MDTLHTITSPVTKGYTESGGIAYTACFGLNPDGTLKRTSMVTLTHNHDYALRDDRNRAIEVYGRGW